MSVLQLVLAQASETAHAAEATAGGFEWAHLLNPAVIWVLIPIVAILVGAIARIIQRSQEHRERMAMIAAGLHPDFPPDEESPQLQSGNLRETTAQAR